MDALAPAVSLLERALGYACGALAGVRDELLDAQTPCADWRLRDLLHHMADSLDALTEASVGLLPLEPAPVVDGSVPALRAKASRLLGAWVGPAARTVRLDPGTVLDARLLLHAGALEVALHGWDVGQATGSGPPLPERLAEDLLPAARVLVTEADRGVRFGPELAPPVQTGAATLLAFCGRTPQASHVR